MGRNGSGVKKASEKSIEIDFWYRGIRCRERIKLEPTPANLKRAESHRQAILDAILNDTFDYAITFPDSKKAAQFAPPKALTTEDWLNQWLDRKEPMLKSSTYEGYYKTVKNILIPKFGNTTLAELKKKEVKEWLQSLTASNKRIKNVLSVLRTALQEAYEDEIITENPLYNFTFKRNDPPKDSDVEPFSSQEQTAILSALSGQAKNLIQFAFWSGLRTSELIALEWRDIDFEKQTVTVARAKTQASRKAETTKTKAGERIVKLLKPALDALNDQKPYTFKNAGVVFNNPRTQLPWAGDAAIRKTLWMPALKKADVKYRRPYQTRHTYASMMLSAGESLAWLSSQIGHASVLMTAQVYARYINDAHPDAGLAAVKLFSEQ